MIRYKFPEERTEVINRTDTALLSRAQSAQNSLNQVVDRINSKIISDDFRVRLDRTPGAAGFYRAISRSFALLSSKAQTATVSASLLIDAIECFLIIEHYVEQNREKLRKVWRENRELKAGIAYYIGKISDSEGSLAGVREETEYWRLMCSLGQLDYELLMTEDDKETWSETIRYDTMWNSEYAGSLSLQMSTIFSEIELGDWKDCLQLVLSIPAPDTSDIATYASLLELTARKFYETDKFSPCLTLMEKVLELRRSVYGAIHSIIPATLNCIALAYDGLGDYKQSTGFINEALELLEKHQESSKNKDIVARQYTRMGQRLVSWGYTKDGIRVMQKSLNLLEDLLPREEEKWCDVINRMSRICNDRGYFDDAMTLTCDVVDYYHAKNHGLLAARVPTIVEVAYAYQLVRRSPVVDFEKLPMTSPAVLSRSFICALKEIGIAFACRHEFRAAQIIVNYLTACSTSSEWEPDLTVMPLALQRGTRITNFLKPKLLRWSHDREPEKKGVRKSFAGLFKSKR